MSRLQEDGRFAIYLLNQDLRMAGFRGCNGGSITPLNLVGSTTYPYQYSTGLAGYAGTGSSWSPALDASIVALNPAPLADRDVVTVRHIDGAGVPLTASMVGTLGSLTVSPGSPVATGDILLVADCSAAAIFQATGVDAGTGAIAHDAGAGSPGNTSADLGHVFGPDASVYRLVSRTYYIGASVTKPGSYSLFSYSVPAYDGAVQPEEMVEGVEKLVFQYGEDTDGDRAANRYVAANSVGTWANVVSVRPQILLATINDGVAMTPAPYTFNSVTVTPTDHRLRSVLSSVATLRNRVP
jgi:type IV pilus assembly protein PilW